MKCNDWDKLRFKKQHRARPKTYEPKTVVGWDTETVKGKVWVICNSEGLFHLLSTPKSLLQFLTTKKYRDKINYFYNLKYDYGAITKVFGEEISYDLYYTGKAEHLGYKLRYIDKKLFSISKHKNTVHFFDLYQFYNMSLENASAKYLTEHKKEIDLEKLKYWKWREKHKQEIIDYCIQDALLTKKLGYYLHNLLNRGGIPTVKPLSQAFIASKYVDSKTFLPRCFFKESDRYAFDAYHGGRFEVLQKGYFPKCYIYDINSAYPHKIANLYDLRYGDWKYAKDIPSDAVYGFVRTRAKCEQDWISALTYSLKGLLVFPRLNDKEITMTMSEFKYIERKKLAELELIDGWFWIPAILIKPFTFIRDLYNKKTKLKKEGDNLALVYKIMLNSIYGKFMETKPYLVETDQDDDKIIYSKWNGRKMIYSKWGFGTGNYFLPTYAAEITARTRLQLLDQALTLKKRVIAMFTDSIFTDKRLALHSDALGQFNLQNKGELVMVGCGIYGIRNEKGTYSKFRGFGLKKDYDLFENLATIKDSTSMKFLLKQVISFGLLAEQTKKYNYGRYNCFSDLHKQLNINFDRKRIWQERFKSCADVMEQQISSRTLPL